LRAELPHMRDLETRAYFPSVLGDSNGRIYTGS
jgi:hypothetical protein